MAAERNAELLRRFSQEIISRGNVSVADEIMADNYVNHNPVPGQGAGREEFKESVQRLRTAFPDLEETIEEVLTDGEKVILRTMRRGTHRAPFMGLPPTGKRTTFSAIYIARVANNKITDIWLNWDALGLLQQIGGAVSAEARVDTSLLPRIGYGETGTPPL